MLNAILLHLRKLWEFQIQLSVLTPNIKTIAPAMIRNIPPINSIPDKVDPKLELPYPNPLPIHPTMSMNVETIKSLFCLVIKKPATHHALQVLNIL